MARKIKTVQDSPLEFKELRYAVKQSFGAKKRLQVELTDERKEEILSGKVNGPLSEVEKKFNAQKNIVCKGVSLLGEFMGGMNPYQLVQAGRSAMQDTDKAIELGGKMEAFIPWLVKRGMSQASAISMRGNAFSLFRYNNIMIKTKNEREATQKEIRDNELGMSDLKRLEILRAMFMRGDFEMKAYLALGLAGGHRISDNVAIKLSTMRTILETTEPYKLYRQIDVKENARIILPLGRFQQQYVKLYVDSIKDGREYLFGDRATEETRIREKFETLLHQVYEGDGNILTPHALRGLCERLLTNKRWNDVQVYAFTGHKANDKYRPLTDEQLIELFKSVEVEVSFQFYNPADERATMIKDIAGSLLGLIENKGKTEHLAGLYHQRVQAVDPAAIDAKMETEMMLAAFVVNLKKQLQG